MSRDSVYDPPMTLKPRTTERAEAHPAAAPTARPAGPAAAVVLAAGLASFALGVLSVLTAASASVSDALTLSDRVGDLSGLTTASTVVFFAAWALLAIVWRHANPRLVRVAAVAAVLIGLGLLGTFPPFFNLFG
jgi:fluoride ion exporter CrcB/FEX